MKTASSRLGGRQKIKQNLGKTNTLLICIGLLRFLSSWSPAFKTQEFPLITQQLFHFQLQFFYHSSLTELYLKSSPCESCKISWAVFICLHTHIRRLCPLQPFSQHLGWTVSSDKLWVALIERKPPTASLIPPALANSLPAPLGQRTTLGPSWHDKEGNLVCYIQVISDVGYTMEISMFKGEGVTTIQQQKPRVSQNWFSEPVPASSAGQPWWKGHSIQQPGAAPVQGANRQSWETLPWSSDQAHTWGKQPCPEHKQGKLRVTAQSLPGVPQRAKHSWASTRGAPNTASHRKHQSSVHQSSAQQRKSYKTRAEIFI